MLTFLALAEEVAQYLSVTIEAFERMHIACINGLSNDPGRRDFLVPDMQAESRVEAMMNPS